MATTMPSAVQVEEAALPAVGGASASDFDLQIEVTLPTTLFAASGKGNAHPDTISYFSLCPSCGGSCTFCPTCPFTCGSCAITCPWCRTGPYCVSVSNCCWTLNGC